MAELTFSLAYDGPSVEDGSMDVRSLAPALLALAEVFRLANSTVNRDASPVTLEIRATARGSFELHLLLTQPDLLSTLVDLLTSARGTALANLMTIVCGTPTVLGLFGLIKWLRNHRIARRENVNVGTVRLTLEDGTMLELPPEVLAMYQSIEIRRRVADVVSPLRTEGITSLEIWATAPAVQVRIEKDEVLAFSAPSLPPVQLLDATTELNLKIVSVTFQEDNKWRLSDGTTTFFADLKDAQFVERVQRSEEAFRNGDILRVQLRVHQEQDSDGDLRTEYTVTKVEEHIPHERLVQLPILEELTGGDDANPR